MQVARLIFYPYLYGTVCPVWQALTDSVTRRERERKKRRATAGCIHHQVDVNHGHLGSIKKKERVEKKKKAVEWLHTNQFWSKLVSGEEMEKPKMVANGIFPHGFLGPISSVYTDGGFFILFPSDSDGTRGPSRHLMNKSAVLLHQGQVRKLLFFFLQPLRKETRAPLDSI